MKEFEIIRRYLNFDSGNRKDVITGIGDDCALLKVPRGQRLAVSMDTLVADVHFLADSNPADIAHKAVAVNLSDLAAAGAEPAWLTLSLTMPKFEESWMEKFHHGLKRMVDYYGVQIVGGDTCQGPLAITIQAHGFVPENVFHRRDGAQAGDLICVTGNLGDAALGLQVAQNKLHVCQQDADHFLKKYYTPDPKIAAGIALRGRATAVIDISDGLLSDVNHISQRSQVGALIKQEWLPLSSAAQGIQNQELVMRSVLTGGDDYELCFTVDEDAIESTRLALETVGAACIPVGRMTGKPGVRVIHEKREVELSSTGFEHF